MSIIKKIQSNIRENPIASVVAATSVGAAAGAWYIFLITKTPSTADTLNTWLFDMSRQGYSVLALDPEEMKRWLTVATVS